MLQCGKFKLDLSSPLVMGVVNVTPDSFSDGGRHFQRDSALAHAQRLIEEGADLLDIGGESTRPGALPVDAQQELDRVLPVLEGLRDAPVPVSVDTCKAEVMRTALAAGASMINDVNALRDPETLTAVAASDAAVCLMHMQGDPESMQFEPHYQDLMSEVMTFLRMRIATAEAAGIARERIMIDPGFGFGKTLAHNITLLQGLEAFAGLGVPVLAGLSRKSMLGAITGQPVGERLAASLAAAMLAVQHGARIVRVHDVKATIDVFKVLQAVETRNGELQ